MIVPDAFNTLCLMFHQDVGILHDTPEGMIADAIRPLDPAGSEELRRFLDDLLDGTHTHQEMQDAWWQSPADIYFPDDTELEAFLRMIRDALR